MITNGTEFFTIVAQIDAELNYYMKRIKLSIGQNIMPDDDSINKAKALIMLLDDHYNEMREELEDILG